MPSMASPSSLRGPTPASRATGIARSSARVMGPSAVIVARAALLDAEQVRVERLAAVVHLWRHVGPVLAQPLGDGPGVGRARALALDDGDDLVLVGHERVEQPDGGGRDRLLDRLYAVAGDA